MSDQSFSRVKCGDKVIWERDEKYGGPLTFDVINTTLTTFRGQCLSMGWSFRFRKSDGRVMGHPHNIFWVRPKAPVGGIPVIPGGDPDWDITGRGG